MTSLTKKCKGKASAKIILSGEHSVLYGQPALAMALDLFAETFIERDQQFSFFINDVGKKLTLSELRQFKTITENKYQQYLINQCLIREVLPEPWMLTAFTVAKLIDKKNIPGLAVHTQINFPTGCGLGASAAAIISTINAVNKFLGLNILLSDYPIIGKEIENLQHGKSSGLDIYLSTYGGCVKFQDGKIIPKPQFNIPFFLINTGAPEVTTGECVQHTAQYLQDRSLANAFGCVTNAMEIALEKDDLKTIQECVKSNHQLLTKLGIVPLRVQQFIAAVENLGLSAKVSGAGACRGENAGIVLIVGTQDIGRLVDEYGYELILTGNS